VNTQYPLGTRVIIRQKFVRRNFDGRTSPSRISVAMHATRYNKQGFDKMHTGRHKDDLTRHNGADVSRSRHCAAAVIHERSVQNDNPRMGLSQAVL